MPSDETIPVSNVSRAVSPNAANPTFHVRSPEPVCSMFKGVEAFDEMSALAVVTDLEARLRIPILTFCPRDV
jgi:hypothetical protein